LVSGTSRIALDKGGEAQSVEGVRYIDLLCENGKMKSNWLLVKNLGRVKYFNISYLVMLGIPVIATVYSSIDNDWLNQNLNFSFPINLKWTYAASISYAFAIAFYQFFCPKIVKRFDTENEYVNAYQHLYERAYQDKKVNIILSNLSTTQEKTKTTIVNLNQKLQNGTISPTEEYELDKLIHLVYPGCVQRFLVLDFNSKVQSRSLAYVLSSLFYLIGTAIMLFLIYDKVLLVFQIN